ncbi:MAG TPA: alpha/beta fold hydrolase, partial [Nocardioidaceae bacterium]|nr:alpha/beta fold hydrolase [Nocardioidaceae bacterium]
MLRDPTDCYDRYRLAVCTYDRPGYGLSTRRPGYTQAQTVDDVAAIADALAWDRFAVAGASGGSGPALAAARFLPDRVKRCAVVVGVGPSTTPQLQEAMDEEVRFEWELAARGDEEGLTAQF